MSATFERLVGIRSVQVQEVRAYLLQLADALDATPWWRGGAPIKASAIAVESLVLTKRERMRPPRPERQDVEAVVAPQSPIDELESPQYELPLRREERQEERWQQVVRRGRARLALLGAPGGGKTFLTRHTIAGLTRQSAAKLNEQQATLDTIEVPMWVTAKALAQTSASDLGDALPEALGNSVLPPAALTPHVRDWLQRAMASPRAVVVVDALDELEDSDRGGFQAKARLLEGLGGRVIVTCRTIPWEERQHWLGWHQVVEVELARMEVWQQRVFVSKFFAPHPALAHRMERLLQTNFALRHAYTSPLLLTFACLLHEEGKVHEDTTRALLYAHMVRKMMSGEWRGVRPPWVGSTVLEERCVHWLEGIAWGLFARAPHLNRFTLRDWVQAAEGHGKTPYAPAEFLEALEQLGLVVPAGFDARGDRCWSMGHRIFLEFLAARALSRLDQRIWLGEAKKHFWFHVEWLEVLTFLAGLVDDATPLIEAVEEEQKSG